MNDDPPRFWLDIRKLNAVMTRNMSSLPRDYKYIDSRGDTCTVLNVSATWNTGKSK